MTLKMVVPPVAEAVSASEMASHLRLNGMEEMTLLDGYIVAATRHVEKYLRRALEPATWEYVTDRFPSCFPIGPVVSVEEIVYRDDDGDHVLEPASYRLVGDTLYPVEAWPRLKPAADAVRVRFVAGDGTPEDVRHAIILMAAHFYEHREAVTLDRRPDVLPLGVRDLLAVNRSFV